MQLHHLGIDAERGAVCSSASPATSLCRPDAAAVLGRHPARRAARSPGCGRRASPATCRSCCCASTTSRISTSSRQLLQAHEYWRMKQLAVDLVILNERASSYVQDLQIAHRDAGAHQPVAAAPGVRAAPRPRLRAARRPDRRPRRARCCIAVARVVLVGAARQRWPSSSTALAEAVARRAAAPPKRAAGRRRRRAAAARPISSSSTASAASPTDGTRIRDDPRARASRRRRPGSTSSPIPTSASRSRPKAAATPGRSTAARTSSRRGRTIRSAIRPGEAFYLRDDDTGELWSPTALPIRDDAATYVARHGQGYSRFEHTRARHRARAAAVRAARRSDQDLAADAAQPFEPRRAACRSPPMSNGCSAPSRGASAPFVVDRDRSATPARCSRAIRGTRDFGSRVAFADLARPADRLDRRPHASSSAATARCDDPAALAGDAPLSNTVGAGLDPCARAADADRARRRTARRDRLLPRARRRRAEDARALIARYRAADLDAVLAEVDALLGRHARRGPGEDARPRDGHHAERLAALPDARLPHLGALGVLSGERRLRLPRPAAGRHGADARAARR